MRIIGILIFFLFYFTSGKVYGSYMILSASKCGEYAIFLNTTNGKKILVDIKTVKILAQLDSSLSPLTWIKDSLILFQKEEINKTYLLVYDIRKGIYLLKDSINNDSNWKGIQNSDFIAFPNNISSYKDAFFVYVETNKLYKYNLAEKKFKEIWEISMPTGYKVNNISVNNDCSGFLFTSRSNKSGMVSMINFKKRNALVVEKGTSLNDEASYAFFLQNNEEALFYKVTNKTGNIKTIEVYLYNLKKRITGKIAVVKCVSLINPFKICMKNVIIINTVNSPNFRMEIKGTFLRDFINAVMDSIGFIEIKYENEN